MWKHARILGLVLFASTTAASGPFNLQPYRDAHAQFLALLAAGESGTPQDLRTPDFARLVAVLSDDGRFLRAKKFTQGDMGDVMDLCDMANRADVSLMFFGAKSRIDPQVSQEEKVRRLMPMLLQNSIDFQPELSTLQPFHIRCLGLSIPLLEEFVRALPPDQMTPVRRDGLAKMRSGYTELLMGMLANIGDARYSTNYRGAVSRATAESSAALASVLTLEQRARLLVMIGRSDPDGPPEWRQDRARIEAALKAPQCSLLCALD